MISAISKKQNPKATEPARNGSSEHFKFIVTGFNSFGKNLENPSGLTALSLPSELEVAVKSGHTTVEIESLLLETCCKSGWASVLKSLKPLIAKKNKTKKGTMLPKPAKPAPAKERVVLIMLGLAAMRDSLNLERLAINVRDYPIRDNRGHQYDGEEITPGPLAIKTNFPLLALRKKLKAKGFPALISNHCGTFVCNDVYYQGLNFQDKHGTPDLVLFIHLPPAHVFAESVREMKSAEKTAAPKRISKAKQIQLLNDAVVEVIKFSVDYLAQKPTKRAGERVPAVQHARKSK